MNIWYRENFKTMQSLSYIHTWCIIDVSILWEILRNILWLIVDKKKGTYMESLLNLNICVQSMQLHIWNNLQTSWSFHDQSFKDLMKCRVIFFMSVWFIFFIQKDGVYLLWNLNCFWEMSQFLFVVCMYVQNYPFQFIDYVLIFFCVGVTWSYLLLASH